MRHPISSTSSPPPLELNEKAQAGQIDFNLFNYFGQCDAGFIFRSSRGVCKEVELNPMNGPEGGGQKHRMRQEQARIDELPTILYYMDGCVYSVSRNVY